MSPSVRTDVVDAYVYRHDEHRRSGRAVEVLQLHRVEAPLRATWQPVMGHVEAGESAVDTMWRELREEVGLERAAALDAYALEQVHPFFIAELDAVFLSPRFAVEVASSFEPVLNAEHDAARWVPLDRAVDEFLWPGQRAALRELTALLDGDPAAAVLRLAR